MNDAIINFFGISSVIFYVISLLPQIVKMIFTKSVEDVSITFLLVCTTGEVFYVLYCIYKDVGPIAWGGYFSLAFHLIMTLLWFYYKKMLCCRQNILENTANNNDIPVIETIPITPVRRPIRRISDSEIIVVENIV